MSSWMTTRARYLVKRASRFKPASVVARARAISAQHHRAMVPVLADMLWSAATSDVNFQDYQDWDFAILNRAERRTYVTNAISNHIAMTSNEEPFRPLFHDKILFNRRFDEFLGREWLEIEPTGVDDLRRFVLRHGRIMGKVPFSNSGYGVARYDAKDIDDWAAFRNQLIAAGQILVEQYIEDQHEDLARVCPTTVNTTRVTTYFDGERTHLLGLAQKFGRGQASDQQSFGGYFILLDRDGRSLGPGYGSHQHIYREHPDSRVSMLDFRLPLVEEVLALVDRAARVVPQVRYVGWDVVVTRNGPVLLEGNWTPGAYENKPSATGVRTGNLPVFREAIGF